MLVREFIIMDEEGFHVRPAQLFVEKAMIFKSNIRIRNEKGMDVDGKSILGLMAMGLRKGAKMIVEIDGEDEEAASEQLELLMNGKSAE